MTQNTGNETTKTSKRIFVLGLLLSGLAAFVYFDLHSLLLSAFGLFRLGLVNPFQRRAQIGSQALPCPVLCGGAPDQYIIIPGLPMGR